MTEHLSDESKALIAQADGMDDPTAEDRARVKRAVMLAIASSAVTGTTAASAGLGAASAGTTVGGAAAASGAAASGAAVSGAAAGLGMKWVSAILFATAVGGGVVAYEVVTEESAPIETPVITVPATQEGEEDSLPAGSVDGETEVPEEPVAEESESELTDIATPEPAEAAPSDEPTPQPSARQGGSTSVERQGSEVGRRGRPLPRVVPPPVQPAPQDDLAVEVDLLRRAQQARAGGDHVGALRLLDEHRRRFPRGSLAAEREVSRILALCHSNRARGRALANRYLERSGGTTPAAARIRTACGIGE